MAAALANGYEPRHVCRIASERVSVVDAPVIVAHDVSYQRGSYRSFEFASFKAAPGALHVLLSTEHAPARDVLLAVAGLVRPTSGSLVVCGVELAGGAPASGLAALRRASAPRERLTRAQVGLGVFERVAEVSGAWTVEEAVAREVRLRGRGAAAAVRGVASDGPDAAAGKHAASRGLAVGGASDLADVLPFLASLGLATASEQEIVRLDSAQRGRLSAALALVGAPQVAVIDLTDPFVAGLSAADAQDLIVDVRAAAEHSGTAVLGATGEPACAVAAEQLGCDVTAIDISAAEALDSARAGRAELSKGQRSDAPLPNDPHTASASNNSHSPKREVMA